MTILRCLILLGNHGVDGANALYECSVVRFINRVLTPGDVDGTVVEDICG